MYCSLRGAILSLSVIGSCWVHAQNSGTLQHPNRDRMKAENALIISWNVVSDDANASQIKVFDEHGRPVVSLNVLQPAQDAKSVTIYDVSARPGNIIAVAAVYGSRQGEDRVRPTATLLLFDFNGRLLSAFALPPSRQINHLAVGAQSDVWTLTDFADSGDDPSTAPMVVEYTSEGAVAREELTRSAFPFHSHQIQHNFSIGNPSLGYGSAGLWFWLPGSTDYVIVSANGSKPLMMKTQLPIKQGRKVVPVSIVRSSSGDLIGEFREEVEGARFERAYYTWSLSKQSWSQFKPDVCDGGHLIGTSTNGQIYLFYQSERVDICNFQPK